MQFMRKIVSLQVWSDESLEKTQGYSAKYFHYSFMSTIWQILQKSQWTEESSTCSQPLGCLQMKKKQEMVFLLHKLTANIYIYIYVCVCVRVGRRVHSLTKILSWNVTKEGLFFNIIPLVVHTLFPTMLQCLDPIGKESYQQQI